jgi:hypothetical protein
VRLLSAKASEERVEMSVRRVVGLGVLALIDGLGVSNPALAQDERLGLSGIWSGTKKQEALGSCKKQDDGETPAAINLKVSEDGKVTGKDTNGRQFEGTLGTDLSLSLTVRGRSKCPGDTEPHDWSVEFVGQVSKESSGGLAALKMQAVEEPCPPTCRFKVEYSLKRTN